MSEETISITLTPEGWRAVIGAVSAAIDWATGDERSDGFPLVTAVSANARLREMVPDA